MNRKQNGFTLVEVLAVISILGVIAILVLPSMLKVFNFSSDKVKKMDQDSLKDSAILYVTDIDNGDISYKVPKDMKINGKDYKSGEKVLPYDMKIYLMKTGLDVPITLLVKEKYYDDIGCNYDQENSNCKINKDCIIHVNALGEKTKSGYYITTSYKATLSDSCLK